MTLTITTGDKRFSMKMPDDECHQKFHDLVLSLMGAYPPEALLVRSCGDETLETLNRLLNRISDSPIQAVVDEPSPPRGPIHTELVDGGWDSVYGVRHDEVVALETYKGFLYVECSHCGKTWGFNAKEERSSVICRDCGKETGLSRMVKAYANCQCGRRFKYLTNHTSEVFDLDCLDCGSPIPLGYNTKKGTYETL